MQKVTLHTGVYLTGILSLLMFMPVMSRAGVPNHINYQGKILEDGVAFTGSRQIIFSLWDNQGGGDPENAAWHELQTVEITDGIYSVELGSVTPLPENLGSNDRLFLQVDIEHPVEGLQRLAPLMPVNSSMFAIKAAVADMALTAIDADTLDGLDSADLDQSAHAASRSNPHNVTAYQIGAVSKETDPTVINSVKDGVSWEEIIGMPFGFADKVDNDSGGDITAVTAKNGISGGGDYGDVEVEVSVPLNLNGAPRSASPGPAGAVISGENSYTGSYSNYGGYFSASGLSGRGIYAEAATTGNVKNYGGNFMAAGDQGRGVYAGATATGDITNYGGKFAADGDKGRGVYGSTPGREGTGVYGEATSTSSSLHYGGKFSAAGANGRAIYGEASNSGSGTNYGGRFLARGTAGRAVYGYATNTGSVTNYGGYFLASGAYGVGIYASGGSGGYAADFRGNVRIRSEVSGATIMELGEGLDYAEGFDVSSSLKIEPGAVMIIDPEHPGKLTLSRRAYDTRVAGIIAGANGLGSGVRLGGERFDHDIALAGRVYCNVDATGEAVEVGDLLTTSDIPGYAMKATHYRRAQGAIVGKAMERLAMNRRGQILILVTLQ